MLFGAVLIVCTGRFQLLLLFSMMDRAVSVSFRCGVWVSRNRLRTKGHSELGTQSGPEHHHVDPFDLLWTRISHSGPTLVSWKSQRSCVIALLRSCWLTL